MNGIIQIEGMEFYAFHGCYKEEQIVGGKFLVDVEITCDCVSASKSDQIRDALNYQKVYEIIGSEMKKKSHLLEHVAARVADKLYEEFSVIKKIRLKISKMNPPLGGQVQKVSIVWEQ
ncbi:MAG: dihydroneopterin aldolase [Bacteroidetes bacterium RIFOXYA12_FULL_35_11]|nr:MAG: dihydroneopterin aldolase [Bacteroidetes bacterium GWF2_35_48]OFY83422.1 MAG: dihydroneopterin aldolase [Bacteroidetes bacterium RIFOXYA12_FULL_35_11]OFY95941.1 MAG: dihydroneopterin aldolase [Bacteroidetes bacterium RIFOXYB2_FULL_35_7]OFY97627.1 MAG: dihydroneopterin aldolase [Bacteroidetes bacterium RIFOXYC12_FULL_35_7]HBX50670.1 dihydroneopterin aldolase [Bacteroidales bacterium]